MYGDRADLGLFSEGLRSQTAFVLSATARSGVGKAGTTAADPGTGRGRETEEEGCVEAEQKLLCLCSELLSPSGTDFFSAT